VGLTDSIRRSNIGGFGNIFVGSILFWSLYCSVVDNSGDAIINCPSCSDFGCIANKLITVV